MDVGKLNRKIQINAKVSSRDGYGAEIIHYESIGSVWAQVIPVSGNEYFSSQQFTPDVTIKFRIRHRKDMDETAKIIYRGDEYGIIYIAETGNGDGLEILSKKS